MNGEDFVGLITTKNLLLNIIKQASSAIINISLDGTYKLNKQGFPTIVIGTKDVQKRFHLSNIKINSK